MLVGFVHGVMNTDNMTISGETIDYGPCAFMDAFDPAAVYSSIDHGGRYAYGNQPLIAQWNLARLAEALLPLLDEEPAVQALDGFHRQYSAAWSAGMRAKLGLPEDLEAADPVIDELLAQLQAAQADYTSSLRALADAARGDTGPAPSFVTGSWLAAWLALGPDAAAMDRVNPVYIPRNHLVEEALAGGDLDRLVAAVSAPYDERPGLERYAAPAPAGFGTYRTFCGT
jgi:uncharacterized protein YdiU (UPF0061 family)